MGKISSKKQKINLEEQRVSYFTARDIQIQLTPKQKPIVNFFVDNQISILTGDPGTGKTTLALYYALKQLLNKEFKQIIITKPNVESSKSVGFLPGELKEKLAPYKESYEDVVNKLVGKAKAAELVRTGKIKFEALGFIRGKTFEESIIIFDEVQNETIETITSFITRIHESSKMILLGDEFQTDIKNSGLATLLNISKGLEGFGQRDLDDSFQMRSKIIVEYYKKYKEYIKSRGNKF